MNFALKSKTYIATNQTIIGIEDLLGANSRLVGITVNCPIALDVAKATVFAFIGGTLLIPMMTIGVGTGGGKTRTKWAGIRSTGHEESVITYTGGLAPNIPADAYDDSDGSFFLCPQNKWKDPIGDCVFSIAFLSSGTGTVVLWYTDDPPIASGENA